MINGFVKVRTYTDGLFTKVELWNPQTKESKTVIVDDLDYLPGDSPFIDREYANACHEPLFDESKEIEEAYIAWRYADCLARGVFLEGLTVEVYKGRKYPIGTTGKVERFYDVYNDYGRWVATYIQTTDGKRIPVHNCKPIA